MFQSSIINQHIKQRVEANLRRAIDRHVERRNGVEQASRDNRQAQVAEIVDKRRKEGLFQGDASGVDVGEEGEQ